MSVVEVEVDLAQEQGALARVLRALTFAPYSIASLTFLRDGAGIGIDRAVILLDLDAASISGTPALLRARLDRMVVVHASQVDVASDRGRREPESIVRSA